jgi:threonine/homoserine/homoserine lactone efflux protein
MTSIGPGRALVTAVVLAVINPKVLFMCAAAGLAIGSAGLGATGAWTADIIFTAVAASSVALPVLAYLVAGEKLDGPLTKLKNWMEEQHAALVAAILVILGLMVLYKGIHGL